MKKVPKQLARIGTTIASLTLALGVASVQAQDTTTVRRDTTLSQERDTTLSQRADTTENRSGYRAMEPAATDTAMAQRNDTTRQQTQADKRTGVRKKRHAADSTKWGYPVHRHPKAQNPAGYRGMERPNNVMPSDSGAAADTAAGADATSRVNQLRRQDSLAKPNQNPPGYRGMERPAALDSAQQERIDSFEVSPSGKATSDSSRQTSAMADSSAVRVGQDTIVDSTSVEMNAGAGDSVGVGSDSAAVVHQERHVAPGVGHRPPPYAADSERVWVQQRQGNDSVSVTGDSAAATRPE